jgi:hypothetical protein
VMGGCSYLRQARSMSGPYQASFLSGISVVALAFVSVTIGDIVK